MEREIYQYQSEAETEDEVNIRVLTLNVWNQEGDPRRMAAINRELRVLDPDLIAFQEVVYTADGNQLDELLRGMDHHWTSENGAWPSDHFGVVVDLEIGKDA